MCSAEGDCMIARHQRTRIAAATAIKPMCQGHKGVHCSQEVWQQTWHAQTLTTLLKRRMQDSPLTQPMAARHQA